VHAVRNEDDIPFTDHVPGVGRLTGKDMRLSVTKHVMHLNGHPVLEEMAQNHERVLLELAGPAGEITI
jgi:hypothetical protein